MFRFERGRRQVASWDFRVGIIFDIIYKDISEEDYSRFSEAKIQDNVKAVQEAIMKLRWSCHLLPVKDDVKTLINLLELFRPDAVVNLCEAFFGRSKFEMNVPAVLELLKIPYTGSPPLTLGLCQNKGLTKNILRANGIPTPDYQILDSYKDWKNEIEFPLMVKPLREDASLGIMRKNFVRNGRQLKSRVDYIIRRYKQPALVEKYIDGRELNVSILGNEKPKVLPISEIIFEHKKEPKIVDYSAKWLEKSEEYQNTKPVCPAKLSSSVEKTVKRTSLKAYKLLGCRDYARVDIRLKNGTPFILEVNANPDISLDSGFVRSLKAAGISYKKFIREIIFFAVQRSYNTY
ncbi:MAG: ATP-grasp domain-containing protein [Candidatus Bathyarchaeia archaeon]